MTCSDFLDKDLMMRELVLRSRLCYRTPAEVTGSELHHLVDAAVRVGCGMVRYDGGTRSTREMVEEAVQVVRAARREGVPCLIDRRADVALAATADGVHVYAEDMPVALARRLLGPGAIVGVTVHSLADAEVAAREGASYLAVGPLFAADGSVEGAMAALLAQLSDHATLPLCGFGGLTLANLDEPCLAQCALVTVRRAVAGTADPRSLLAALVARLERPQSP